MAVTNYAIAICLLAATFTPVQLTSSTTTEAATSEASTTAAATAASSTAEQSTTAAAAAATTAARNISCHSHSCEVKGCLQAAISNTSVNTEKCTTAGNCFVKQTANTTYTKEEAGCDTSACATTIQTTGDEKKICCTTNDCNGDTNAFKSQSNAPPLSYKTAIVISFFILCLNRF